MSTSPEMDKLCLQIPEWVRERQRQRVKPEGLCLKWQGTGCGQPGKDYGRFKHGNKTFQAHRAMLMWAKGAPGPLQIALHTCGNQWCVNVKHLRWGTPKENGEDFARHSKKGPGMPRTVDRLKHRFARAWQAWRAS